MARIQEFPKGKVIFREGDDCPGTYVLYRGRVRVFKIAPNGKEHVLHFAYPGMSFAEVACIGRFDSPAFAEATEDTECVLLPQRAFLQVLESDGVIAPGTGSLSADQIDTEAAFLGQCDREPGFRYSVHCR